MPCILKKLVTDYKYIFRIWNLRFAPKGSLYGKFWFIRIRDLQNVFFSASKIHIIHT